MAPEKITLVDHYKGDSWVGMIIGPVLFNGTAPLADLASCKLQFRDEFDALGQEFNIVGEGGAIDGAIGLITIDDAATWEITVPVQPLNCDAGVSEDGSSNKKTWYWDFETVDADGVKLTIYKGTIKVFEDVTA